jgi:protein-disulfide isomerase
VTLLFLAASAAAIVVFPRGGEAAAVVARANQPTTAAALSEDTRSDFEQYWTSLPRSIVPVSNEGAAVVIVKFTDYQCPMCGSSYFELQPVLAKYEAEMPGAVKLVPKDYPLNQQCNPSIARTIHPGACAAAVAVRLAARHHREAEMEAWLYSNQTALTPETVREAADKVAGVTPGEFESDYPAVVKDVEQDVAMGQLLKVESTPTFFVNGVRIPNGSLPNPALWDEAIRLELKRVGKTK